TALAPGPGPDLLERLPDAERAVGDRELGADGEATPPEIEQQLAPGLRAFPHPVDQANQLLLALGRGADDDQQALGVVFQPGLHMNAVGPEVDMAPGRQVALQPARMLVRPGVLQPRDGGRRQSARLLAEQGRERLAEVAGRDALEVEDRDRHLQAPGPARIAGQERRAEADALPVRTAAVAHARRAHRDRADPGHDRALGQMAVAYQASAAILGQLVGMAPEKGG